MSVAACSAEIVVVPPLRTVINPLVGLIAATAGLELLYVIAPVLTDDGMVGVNG